VLPETVRPEAYVTESEPRVDLVDAIALREGPLRTELKRGRASRDTTLR
jgi:hypothetical protein